MAQPAAPPTTVPTVFADDGFERFGRQTLAHRAVLVFAVVF
ncbi:hypothetical protein HAH_4193 [Haloarcula hispanica ATCC 33960]|uniref:Uncharacterized protein n=1 Tax=Haloarcula hispanica (strain ATCC 33960 / DSM 4426 / JCM 8911 / NBRC 102182 / NCIMB 2187 / VKM B-1755) TaxID=634497 RepID=G0HYG7_HALHT|nr:hypothetical protein HAH_4193 [Haloarcula hispanica ATCC 33960]